VEQVELERLVSMAVEPVETQGWVQWRVVEADSVSSVQEEHFYLSRAAAAAGHLIRREVWLMTMVLRATRWAMVETAE
jgi:hypothetical protein